MIEVACENEIAAGTQRQLAHLLDLCFPDTFEARTYFKQLPHQRLIAKDGDTIVGQMGVDNRIIRVGDDVLKIAGIIDLSVLPNVQKTGVASRLLNAFEHRFQSVDFFALMADDPKFYQRHGYKNLELANVKWLAIEDRTTLDVIENDMTQCFMDKPVKRSDWPKGTIDMLGYLF